MINAKTLSYPSTDQALNKINHIHSYRKMMYLICDTNFTLTNTYDQNM